MASRRLSSHSHIQGSEHETCQTNGLDEHELLEGSNYLHLVARYKCIEIAKPNPSSTFPCLAISGDEINPSMKEWENEDMVTARARAVISSLRFQMDTSVWEVVHKEVMDWRDSSWTSLHLPRNKMSLTLCLPSWDAQQPPKPIEYGDPRRLILAQVIPVQLLASCFSSPRDINTATLPSGWYHSGHHVGDSGEYTRLVSSLRQHSQHKHSPAYGYQARNSSAVDTWPNSDVTISRESRLADEVSRNRMIRQVKGNAKASGIRMRRLRHPTYRSDEIDDEHDTLPRHSRRRVRSTLSSSSSRRRSQGRYVSRPVPLDPDGTVRQIGLLRVIGGLRHRDVSDENHHWSLEPRLRQERHPVFVQPVKEYVMKRWRTFRSRTRHDTSTLASGEGIQKHPAHRHLDSHIPRDSLQLNRSKSTQIMTVIQGSGSSLTPPVPDYEASPKLPVSPATTGDSHRSKRQNHPIPSTGCTPSPPTHTRSVNSPQNHGEIGETSYFPLIDEMPEESPQPPNLTSTSGTTIYSPPHFAEASPNTKKLESDESTSFGPSPQTSPTFL